MVTENLDVFLNDLIDRHYRILKSVFDKRLAQSNDRKFVIQQYIKRIEASIEFRKDINEKYKTFVDLFENDYKLGNSIYSSIKKFRKTHATIQNVQVRLGESSENVNERFVEVDSLELLSEDSLLNGFDEYSDKELVRLFGEYLAKSQFSLFLKSQFEEENTSPRESIFDQDFVNKKTEFTLARQVLAIQYLLKACDVKDVDNTERARFIEFLTSKSYENIYKKVRNSSKYSSENQIKDLRFVRSYFEKLKMNKIIDLINKELDNIRHIYGN